MIKKRKLRLTQPANFSQSKKPELPTFLDHVHELRRRLFWVIGVIITASSAAYPFLDYVIKIVTAPLSGQQLYYLTPVGGMSFSIKLCVFIGVIVAVPVIMYHLYRFLEPIMGEWRRSAVFYVGLSSLLAVSGILFAYYLSLPGALRFLTGLNLDHIQAMLTVDSYLSFVMTYLLGSALLFQIPLLLVIINTMTPLKPNKLMKSQRYVIVAAFIIAAIISPTPDLMNQLIFALPIIAMYELGVIMVWLQNKRRTKAPPVVGSFAAVNLPQPAPKISAPVKPSEQPLYRPMDVARVRQTTASVSPKPPAPPNMSMDGFKMVGRLPTSRRPQAPVPPPIKKTIRTAQRPTSVDGFINYRFVSPP